MKIDVIVYFLIVLFTFLLIMPYIPYRIGTTEGMKEGMDDCLAGTLSDIKVQLSDLKKEVETNSEDIKRIKTIQETPTETEKQAFSDVSTAMPELLNSTDSN